jgi:hypothetical protein
MSAEYVKDAEGGGRLRRIYALTFLEAWYKRVAPRLDAAA